MKNAINYYYGIDVIDIHQKNDIYIIKNIDTIYALQIYENDPKVIDDIYELSIILNNNGIYCHNIIKNKENNILTNINNKLYILMEIKADFKKKIDLQDIINYSFKISSIRSLEINNWKNLWMNKVDYFEYQMNQFGLNYPITRESSSYFIGITENGIGLLNEVKNDELFLSHRRICSTSTLYDLYNPLNLIFDSKVRDTAEYFKSKLFEENKLGIIKYIESSNLTANELLLFFIRILYPSFYFDEFENILRYNKDENKIKKIVKIIPNYELLIKELYHYLNTITIMPNIEWLKIK